jgi:23S rRNA (adenine2030-N6)-methyltransferase
LRAVLPPPSRRGQVPTTHYEHVSDNRAVSAAMRDSLERFATGTYAHWYPMLQRREAEQLPDQLRRIARDDWLQVSLAVTRPAADGFGLHGSGVFVFNPPWHLESVLRAAMPVLVKALGQDDEARYDLRSGQA